MFLEFVGLFAGLCKFALKNDLSITDSGQPQFNSHFRSSFNWSGTFCSSENSSNRREITF